MPEDTVSQQELQALADRVTGIVDSLNEVNKHGREYVDAANKAQDTAMKGVEKNLVDLFDKKLQEHDKAIRKFISEEAAKVSKALKKR